jgi:mannose/fructose/N-acetylgalactosamine-specific phosphotransferase system component IIB
MIPLLDNKTKKSLLDLTQQGVGKASVLSISLAIVILSTFLSCGLFLYFNKDAIISLVQAVHDIEHIKHAHAECTANVNAVKERLEIAESEIKRLKELKVAIQ